VPTKEDMLSAHDPNRNRSRRRRWLWAAAISVPTAALAVVAAGAHVVPSSGGSSGASAHSAPSWTTKKVARPGAGRVHATRVQRHLAVNLEVRRTAGAPPRHLIQLRRSRISLTVDRRGRLWLSQAGKRRAVGLRLRAGTWQRVTVRVNGPRRVARIGVAGRSRLVKGVRFGQEASIRIGARPNGRPNHRIRNVMIRGPRWTPPARRAAAPSPAPAPAAPISTSPFSGPNTPFGQRIAADARVHPGSSQMISALASIGRFNLALENWSVPVYTADARTPRHNVSLTASWSYYRSMQGVPIPPNAQPDPAGDGHLSVLDPVTGCAYDFWQARRAGSGWSASWGNSLSLNGNGVFAGGLSARGSGFALAAGLVWPQELRDGAINHALVFAFPNTAAGGPVAPASKSDGTSTGSSAIPMGARIQLDPSLDIDRLGLRPYERTIARALQEYGAFVGDTGGSPTVYAANPISQPAGAYDGLVPAGASVRLDRIPLDRFRVLATGPQQSNRYFLNGDGCARMIR